jgi:putative ABC transport system permease protein
MSALIGSWTLGLILALLALGVFISFRVVAFPDITVDGSITLGAAIAAVLIEQGVHPVLATAAAFGSGMLAGAATGILHTQFKIDRFLAGILVMTSLFSINLRIMGKSNVSIPEGKKLVNHAETWAQALFGNTGNAPFFHWQVNLPDVAMLGFILLTVVLVTVALYAFLRTDLGTAMRATGDNDQMIRALGVNVGLMIVVGLALANGLVAVSGALLAQQQGFADVQMGIGMIVWGLASVIIGEALIGSRHLGLSLVGAIMGAVLYRLMIALVLRAGANANDLKLITSAFVFLAMILPGLLGRLKRKEVKHA